MVEPRIGRFKYPDVPNVRAELAVRDALVRTRTRYIGVIKALVRGDRLRVASGEPVHLLPKLAARLDDLTRFTNAHQVEAYLGLTPSEHSSGDQ